MASSFPPPGYIPAESAVEGIEVFQPAPPEEEHRPLVDFKCPQCGANTAFSIADGGLTCTHCGYYEAPSREVVGKGAIEFEFTLDTMERAAQGWGEARKELDCQNCGARTAVPVDTLTHTCPFCGSLSVIQRQAPQDLLRPRFLIPFKIQLATCQQIARQWLGSSWIVPASMKRLTRVADFTPLFLPYWTFDSMTTADWKAEVGHTVSERYFDPLDKTWKTRTRTVWRWESGRVTMNFDDLLLEGTTRLSARLLARTRDYDLNGLTPYDASYLAGMYAQGYDLPLEPAWEKARLEMREQTRLACLRQASSPQVRNFSMSMDYSQEDWRYVLLPIYLAAFSHQGRNYQILINGETGSIAGQRPVDWRRVWLVIAALLAPGSILGIVGAVTILLGGVGLLIGGVGFLLLLAGILISVVILLRAQSMDDI